MLPGVEAQLPPDFLAGFGRQVVRTFSHDDDVCAPHALRRLTQPPGGQQRVVGVEAAVVCQQDVQACPHVTVLECVVEDDAVRRGGQGEQVSYPVAPVGIGRHYGIGIFAVDLQGLVADVSCRGAFRSHHPAMPFPSVAPTEQGDAPSMPRKEADEVFGVRGLSRASHGEVADADDGHVERLFPQDACVEHQVARPDSQAIKPGKGQQPTVDVGAGGERFHGFSVGSGRRASGLACSPCLAVLSGT